MPNKKNILVVARYNQPEALRVAAGLTLLDDAVKVDTVERLLDVLEFVGIPLESLDFGSAAGVANLARDILNADVIAIV